MKVLCVIAFALALVTLAALFVGGSKKSTTASPPKAPPKTDAYGNRFISHYIRNVDGHEFIFVDSGGYGYSVTIAHRPDCQFCKQ